MVEATLLLARGNMALERYQERNIKLTKNEEKLPKMTDIKFFRTFNYLL